MRVAEGGDPYEMADEFRDINANCSHPKKVAHFMSEDEHKCRGAHCAPEIERDAKLWTT